MMVMILQKVPPSLRGSLSRWLIEPHPGVFVGHVTALVRDELWNKCCGAKLKGGIVQIWSTNNEQHFEIRIEGTTKRIIQEYEGIQLIKTPL